MGFPEKTSLILHPINGYMQAPPCSCKNKQMSPTETGKCVNSHPPIRPRLLLLFLRSLCCQNCVLQWPPRQYLRNHANGCWWRWFVQKRRKSAEIGSERDLSKQTSESKLQSTNPVLHRSSNNAKKKIIVTSKSKKHTEQGQFSCREIAPMHEITLIIF